MAKSFYVTTPIYYVNDVPHLGTAYSTIAADVLARYHRIRGENTYLVTGTDEHGLKLQRIAEEQGSTPKAFTDRMSAPFRDTWPQLNCTVSDFVRTTDPRHEAKVQEMWRRVRDRGDLYLGAYEGFYCVGCEAYFTEKELLEGNVCPLHRKPVERIQEPTYFFRLSAYADRLLDFYDRHPQFVQPTTRLNEVTSFVRGGLEDLSVSRTTFNWGIPVPDDPAHVMYVWFDALFSYLTPLLDYPHLERFWPANLHVVGKDILRFHAVYWPAFLLSAGYAESELPKQIFAHGFLTFNGQKMSKSLRNTVRPIELADALGVDPLRYYLMRGIAFGNDGDFNIKDLIGRYNADLGNSLGNLLNRTLSPSLRMFGSVLPSIGPIGDAEQTLHRELDAAAAGALASYESVQPHRALESLWGAIAAANQYVDKTAPWAAVKQGDAVRAGTIFATVFQVLDALSPMIWPVMPATCDALRAQLGLSPVSPEIGRDLWPHTRPTRVAGEPLGIAAPLFPRIDPDREKALIAQLAQLAPPVPQVDESVSVADPQGAFPSKTVIASAEVGAPAIAIARSADATIPYDSFAAIDLRVGVIVAAQKIAGKDKLLALTVDIGELTPREIIAGLALTFAPDTLIGRRVVVVANLEPRSFGKGLTSHGMLLATGPSDALQLATIGDGAPPGARIK